MNAAVAIRVSPITDADVPAVAAFLHAHLNRRVPADAWARAVDVPWKVDAPNHGFMLVTGDRPRDGGAGPEGTAGPAGAAAGELVGAYLAFYSERLIDGRPERFCNLGAWCVLPGYRFHGPRLLKALLAQPDLHFTDLSPSGSVVAMNERLRFRSLDTTTALVPNLPWPPLPGRPRVSADPAVIERTLTGRDLDIYRDHAGAAAARHLVLRKGDRWCYVMFRKDRRKRLPWFASILHVSDPALFRELAGPLSRHLLLRHGALATLAELRVIGGRPRRSVRLPSPRRKMFRSTRLEPDHIDYLYSELVCVAW